MVYNTTQHPPTPHPPANNFCIQYTVLYVHFWGGARGGGVGEVREKGEGQQFTRGVENINTTDCISSLLNTSKDDI